MRSDQHSPAFEPMRRRLVRTLLYGSSADRPAKAKARVGLAMLAFGAVYAVIAARLLMLGVADDGSAARSGGGRDAVATARPDMLDRNGELLATDVKSASLFAEPRRIVDVDEAVELLTAVLPDLDPAETRSRLASQRGFAWLQREITPEQQQQIHRLGIPSVGFLRENKRAYPNGALAAHVLGHVNVDNQGIAGLERWLDGNGLADLHMAGFAVDRQQKPVELAVDLRVQHALRDELIKSKEKFKAIAAAGLVTDVRTGEIVAMVSVPDYDPNNPREANDPTRLNRLTTGVFEMGSTFKALTVAMALDSGKFSLGSSFDVRAPLRFGRLTINDYRGQRRVLSLPEVFTYSSNIGTARMALTLGNDHQREFLRKLGQLDRLRTELPESAAPLLPRRWTDVSTATIAFGHGLSVAPLQAVMGIGALVNGGYLVPPTFLKRSPEEAEQLAVQVIKPETSRQMRYLMRLNSEVGSGRRADVAGFYVGGKTGSSQKVINGRYAEGRLLNTFTAILPSDEPRYQVLIMLDEPKALPETHGFNTSGWNAAPTAGSVIARIAPLLGLEPRPDLPRAEQLILGRGARQASAR